MVISGNILFFGLVILGSFLTLLASKRPNILLALSASLTWLAIALLLWFSTSPIFGLSEDWSKILVAVFFMLFFVPLLFQMDTEIKYESGSKRWTEFGSRPKRTNITDRSKEYQDDLRKRLNSASKGRRLR